MSQLHDQRNIPGIGLVERRGNAKITDPKTGNIIIAYHYAKWDKEKGSWVSFVTYDPLWQGNKDIKEK